MCLGNRQTCPANMVLICFQSSGKLFSSKKEGGGNISLREREKKELISILQKVNLEVLTQILNKLQGSRTSWWENTAAVSTPP